jgi:hypothetical protein
MKIGPVLKAALSFKKFKVMLTKVRRRAYDGHPQLSSEENLAWCSKHALDIADLLNKKNADLWKESVFQTDILEQEAGVLLRSLPFDLGGGGATPLLYFLTRLLMPVTTVETGVASGHSSLTLLTALEKNGAGLLYSSDFPYFRIPESEKYVGLLVPSAKRANWRLFTEGDSINLRKIIRLIDRIDLFHYDSDKSYLGRWEALKIVSPYFTTETVIVIDDIQDNSFFHDYITANPQFRWAVLDYKNKFVGLLEHKQNASENSILIQ